MINNKDENKSFDFIKGEVLLVNKPYSWTSFNVVNKIRYTLRHYTGIKRIKVGHAGTLDPLASGLLIICTGKFTKRIEEFQGLEKEYTGTMLLGKTTPSFDLETEVDQEFPTDHITEDLIKKTIPRFLGEIEQIPPIFSAIKIDGKRAYNYARKNENVHIKSKIVSISSFEITNTNFPELEFRIVCSKGTYIRSLVRDFGQVLNSGAHLTSLCRTRIGDFHLKNAIDPEKFRDILNS